MTRHVTLRLVLALVIVTVAVAAGALAWWLTHRAAPIWYVTAPATQGDVIKTITASGTVNPVTTVQVGTYVSGTIQSLACDYNTRVHKGQLCAKIDPKPYQMIVAEASANLATAKAQLAKDQANRSYTKITRQRYDELLKRGLVSHDAADAALNADRQAQAQVAVDAAQITQRAAALAAAQINLDYTNIVSPVDGTVVSRNVTAGQTVAASLQTPTLFLIATDLTRMQVDTNVSESDIPGATEGALATFTVDAFPEHRFEGKVAQVRQAPISVQNVITYDVVITAANPQLMLKPGMTATAHITTAQALNVLRVPSQALRFTPASVSQPPTTQPGRRIIWVQRAGKLVAVAVNVGVDDDRLAEVRAGDLHVGDRVVISESAGKPASKPARATAPSLRL